MGHHSCTCCCAHDNAQPKNTSGNTGFLKEYRRILLSALLLFGGIAMKAMNISFFSDDTVVLVWYLLAYLPVGLPVLKEAWESILRKDVFSEFTLMSIATLGAFYIKEYPEGVAVMLFYSLGELFQDKAVSRAKRNISALLDVRPEKATVIRDNEAVTESPRNVQVGDIIEVKPGERVPLDGTMLGESAAFNTSALTGESVPRTIRKGEEVLAGMIATDKVIRVEVTKPFEKSALSRILELVQNASERKAPAELFIRRFARIYTPIVTGLAVLIVLLPFLYSLANTQFIFTFDDWLYRALVFLVISCPCALVVSIPLGYFGGIGAASRLGVLFKGGNYLDAITKVNTVVFDKTGTLTKGTFEVQSCRTQHGVSEEKLIQIIASAECNSTHPIAKAITGYAEQRRISFVPTAEVTEIAGHGLETKIDGQRILVGNARLLSKYNVEYPQELSKIADTVVVCAIDSAYAGYLLLSDTLKEDARKAIEDLKALNINNIQILSGDKQAIVTNFAEKLGVTQAYGDLLPDGKVEHIEELRQNAGNRIAFVGDGINDAPVLALSHVGIAMGGLGSDAAIETADVVIQTDQPSKVATAIRAGKQTRRIVWQNISLAFGVKLLVLILGAGGLATLWEAVFADVGVALIAIVNAIRIQKLIK
ncbi:heavy metal translocating P-type ATPase [Bacteroides clarus]|uniref:heavy metal translocating P-type ATPase n=1 Tax=Bacteroides clarus TaxID=626929 RepID=UPI003FED449B